MSRHDDTAALEYRSAGAPSGGDGRRLREAADRPPGRILIVAPQPFYQDRGTPIAVRQVLQALDQLGYGVDLLTYPIGHDVELPRLRTFRSSNPLRVADVPVGLSLRKLVCDVTLTSALRRRLLQERYWCIQALEEAAFPAAVLARRHGIPLLYDMQSSMPEQLSRLLPFRVPPVPSVLRAAERWLLRHSSVVVTSAGLAARVRRTAPGVPVREWRFPSDPVTVGAAEVARLRTELGLTGDRPVVLYSGTFEWYQGLPELIEAIPAVLARVPAATFVLVGADPVNVRVARSGAAALAASGALRIVERQPRELMAAYLTLADVLVSPRACGANLPLKVFDYLAAGRPIVATDIPTHRTVLTEERAVLVPPGSDAIAQGILSVLEDPGRARRLAAAARRYAHEHLGWDGFVDSVAGLYQEVKRHGHALSR